MTSLPLVNNLPQGKMRQLLEESPTATGSKTYGFTLDAEDVFVTLYATAISGSLTLKVYEYVGHIDEGKNNLLQDFGTLTGADIDTLITRKAGTIASNLYVEVTYTGACSYGVYVKGAAQGEASVRILGANAGRNSNINVTTTPVNVIPTSLTDRAGILIWNNSTTTKLWWGFTSSEASPTTGMPLLPQAPMGIDMASGAEIWMRSDSGTVDVRISEASS